MTNILFNITFETVTPESAEHGDFEETGFLYEGLTFREAMDALRWNIGGYVEADSYPLHNPRWFTFYNAEVDCETGAVTHWSLHIPAHITEASRQRIGRFIGCYGAK